MLTQSRQWEMCEIVTWFNYISELEVLLLTHWGHWVTHICGSKLTIIGWNNGMSPGRHQAIIWTNAGVLLNGSLWTYLSEIVIEIHTFSFKKMHLKMSSGKWRPFCLGLNIKCIVIFLILNTIIFTLLKISIPPCWFTHYTPIITCIWSNVFDKRASILNGVIKRWYEK